MVFRPLVFPGSLIMIVNPHRRSTISIRNWEPKVTAQSLQPFVLCFAAFTDRDVEVCVFPKCEESVIGSLRLGLVSRKSERFAELQVRERPYGIQPHNTAMIEDLLKFGNRFRIPVRCNQCLAA